MNRSRPFALVAGALAAAILVGCNSTPARRPECALPQGPDLDRALSSARFDLEMGCEARFGAYFQRLLAIAEGDPKKANRARFSEFLVWANEQGLLSKRQARERYNRFFGVKYVSLVGDYSVCSQACPHRPQVLQDMKQELVDKEQGLLKVSADPLSYHRASRLFQETELVLEATCTACGPME
jgi:hypothetical protein